jgi:acetolactate synthase-1/2/3 large subunit
VSKITGGELFARALQAEGIEFVFGLPCPEIDPLLAQLDQHGIRFVPVRHEAAAVHMAEGLYKSTGKVAAVLGNPGPGAANLLPGVVTAMHEGVPVLVISSQHRLGLVYPSSPATYQGQDQLDLFRVTVKWGGPVLQWNRIPEVVRLAFRAMWVGRPGPVHIDLPAPILYETGDEETAPILPPSAYRACGPFASAGQLDEAAALLATAARPIVIAGSGVDRGEANQALLDVVELLGCPVLTSVAGRATVPADHPNFVFGFGPGGDAARTEADMVLVAGSRLGNLDVPYDKYWGDPGSQKVIQIDVDANNVGVTRPLKLGIIADVRSALEGIADRLRAMDRPRRQGDALARYRKTDAQVRAAHLEPVEQWQGPGIHPGRVLATIGDVFGSDPIYCVNGGYTALWAFMLLPSTRARSYHGNLELGMLGTGIPQAVGSKLGAPDREVVCVTGDGAAGFNIMEMQSAARENLKLTTIVFTDGSWTMEESNQLMLYARTFGTEQGPIRWDIVAQGLGCHGEYVEKIEDLEAALRRCRETDGPSLVCVRTNHDANRSVPMDMGMRFFEVYGGPIAG